MALLPAHPAAWPSRSTRRAAHRATIAALKLAPERRPPDFPAFAADDGRRARLPVAGRPRRRVRQGCRGARADARPRLRLRRGRDGHAAAAGGQSEAAAVPAGRGPGGDQPHGLQQSRPAGRVRAAAAMQPRAAASIGVNIGANKDSADRIADYVAGVRAMSAGRRLSDDQHQLAQHAGPARSCRTRARSTRCWRRCTRRASRTGRRSSSRSRPTSARASPTGSSAPRSTTGSTR